LVNPRLKVNGEKVPEEGALKEKPDAASLLRRLTSDSSRELIG
jgi:hypothetical protein